MDAVLDSSVLISLAWSGLLELLPLAPLALSVPEVVHEETVTQGLARGHPDASAIESAIKPLPVVQTRSSSTTDAAVLERALTAGVLLTNDVVLGRRAANLGSRWLRTADLVVLCVRGGKLEADRGLAALDALRAAGGLSESLFLEYRQEI